ncbi:MAG: hypothetical protein SNI87_06180 [Rikenellaceae bacterium]
MQQEDLFTTKWKAIKTQIYTTNKEWITNRNFENNDPKEYLIEVHFDHINSISIGNVTIAEGYITEHIDGEPHRTQIVGVYAPDEDLITSYKNIYLRNKDQSSFRWRRNWFKIEPTSDDTIVHLSQLDDIDSPPPYERFELLDTK